MSDKALAILWERTDVGFFRQHPDRCYHIRKAYIGEHAGEFWSLGAHDKNRRHVLLCRVDYEKQPLPDGKILKLPMLAFADESIADTDEVLAPIVQEIMLKALRKNAR